MTVLISERKKLILKACGKCLLWSPKCFKCQGLYQRNEKLSDPESKTNTQKMFLSKTPHLLGFFLCFLIFCFEHMTGKDNWILSRQENSWVYRIHSAHHMRYTQESVFFKWTWQYLHIWEMREVIHVGKIKRPTLSLKPCCFFHRVYISLPEAKSSSKCFSPITIWIELFVLLMILL